jgi:hypothetical protein
MRDTLLTARSHESFAIEGAMPRGAKCATIFTISSRPHGWGVLTDRLFGDEPKKFQDFLCSLDCDDAECHAF